MIKNTFSISVSTNIINKEAFDGCQKGFKYRSGLSVDDIKLEIHKGHAIAAAEFKDNYRLNANFIKASVLILDFDNSQKVKTDDNKEEKVQSNTFTIEQALEHPFVKKHCFYGYTSYSHTEGWHKFRLCFYLPFEITDQHQFKAITRHIATNHLQGADMTATSASNIFFGNTNAIDIIDNPNAIAIPDEVIIEALETWQAESILREQRKAEAEQIALRRRAELLASGREDDTDKMVDIALTYIPPVLSVMAHTRM